MLRDGDPDALAGFYDARGGAARAYLERVVPTTRVDTSLEDAFAAALETVRADTTVADDRLDPLVHDAVRAIAAERAIRPSPAQSHGVRRRLRGGAGLTTACALMPRLLAARAAGTLSPADHERVARHVARCDACRALELRFEAAERAWEETTDVSPPARPREALLARFAAHEAPEPEPEPRPGDSSPWLADDVAEAVAAEEAKPADSTQWLADDVPAAATAAPVPAASRRMRGRTLRALAAAALIILLGLAGLAVGSKLMSVKSSAPKREVPRSAAPAAGATAAARARVRHRHAAARRHAAIKRRHAAIRRRHTQARRRHG